jgi:hypothetical protein
MRSEKDKMLSGELYNPFGPQLCAERREARLLVKRLNDTGDDQVEECKRLIEKLLPSAGEGAWIEPPFFCDYGSNITLGQDLFFNFSMLLPYALGHAYCLGQRSRFMLRHIRCARPIEERSVNRRKDRNRRRCLDRRGRDHLPQRTHRRALCGRSWECGDKGYTRRCRCSG